MLPMGCVNIGPGFTIILYVLVEGQPFKVEVIVKVTVFGVVLELLMVKAGIELPFPKEGFTFTPDGIVVATQEKLVPVSAIRGKAVVDEPEQMVCVAGLKVSKVGVVPMPKV